MTDEDERLAVDLLYRAITAPLMQIAENAGTEGAVVLERVKGQEFGFGWNAATGVYENLLESGVIDPATVTQQAVLNSASIADRGTRNFLPSEGGLHRSLRLLRTAKRKHLFEATDHSQRESSCFSRTGGYEVRDEEWPLRRVPGLLDVHDCSFRSYSTRTCRHTRYLIS